MSQLATYLKLAPSPEYFCNSGDGLLFACLQAVATDREFQIEDYMHEDGQVFRNPAMATGVHELGSRESTISRDMFMGLFCYCLHFKRLDILENVWAYGWKHGWKMGTENRRIQVPILGSILGDTRVWFTPGLIILLASIIAHLRGRRLLSKLLVNIWQPMSSTPGYQSHLSMLHIYLNRRIRGNLITGEYATLWKILAHSPRNPLALALYGCKRMAVRELERVWPMDRLPTYEDWTEEWRTQRSDADSGFVGRIGDIREHSGGDLLFVHHALSFMRE